MGIWLPRNYACNISQPTNLLQPQVHPFESSPRGLTGVLPKINDRPTRLNNGARPMHPPTPSIPPSSNNQHMHTAPRGHCSFVRPRSHDLTTPQQGGDCRERATSSGGLGEKEHGANVQWMPSSSSSTTLLDATDTNDGRNATCRAPP
jgi:hypothetical protein